MGGANKLLALFDGEPLVRRTAARALASRAAGVTVVTGHQAERVAEALAGLDVRIVHNSDFGSGLAGSLRAGVAAVPEAADGMLVLLGDMPEVTAQHIDRLIAAFAESEGNGIVRAGHAGRRGNPVILPRRLFAALMTLEGDAGARTLIEAEGAAVIDIEIGQGATVDVDTPEALRQAGGVLRD